MINSIPCRILRGLQLPILALAVLLAAPGTAVAQPPAPQIAKTSASRSFSAFLFGSLTARKTQMLYPPANLTGPVTAGSIQRLYFMHASTGATATATLTDLVITLGQTANTTFVPATRFYSNQDTVVNRPTHTIVSGTLGDWFSIDLDTSFTYDPTQTLIVGVTFGGNTNAGFGAAGDLTIGAPGQGKKLYAPTDTATIGNTGSGVWQHFGFDLNTLGLSEAAPASFKLRVFPNPATNELTVTAADLRTDASATLTLTDLLGRTVQHHAVAAAELRAGRKLSVQDLPTGTYVLTVQQDDRQITRRVVVR